MDENVINNSWGLLNLSRIPHPAESFLLGDCKDALATPWNLTPDGLVGRVAYANACGAGCNAGVRNPNNTRHSDGSNIGYMDGHVKWVNYQLCKDVTRGGRIRFGGSIRN
ncbi:MAG: H-X9-DG-CTERM domain-containing protein [Armatimonadota bacterium]